MSTASPTPSPRSWFRRHRIWTAIGAVILVGSAGSLLDDDEGDSTETAQPAAAASSTPPPQATVTVTEPTAPTPASRTTEAAPSRRKPSSSLPPPPAPTKTTPRGVPAAAQAAVVTSITDGDTLHLHTEKPGQVLQSTDDLAVRLLEIDTPETVDPGGPVACYGPAATAALTKLAPPGTKVWVLDDQDPIDPYGRSLLYLWSTDQGRSKFVNLELVRDGFAKAVLYEPNDLYIDVMRQAEVNAQAAGRGLWGACDSFGAPLNPPSPTPSVKPSPRPFVDPKPGKGCDPSYTGACKPPYPPDLDCTEISDQGFAVVGSDPHGFDADNDGIGCES